MKQHLSRKHAPPFYCEFCLAVLPDKESHEIHVRSIGKTCSYRECRFPGITHQQQRELSRKLKPNLSEREGWFTVWDIVFPGQPRPSSPYIDMDISEDLCYFKEYLEARVPAVIAAEVQASMHAGGYSVANPEELTAAMLPQVISSCFTRLFDDWLAERASRPQPTGVGQALPTTATPDNPFEDEFPGGQFGSNAASSPTQQEIPAAALPTQHESLQSPVCDFPWRRQSGTGTLLHDLVG